ncbi:MAG TPA: hypothetical protein VGJ88_09775 [Thermoanaerobaculia bacterium]
MTDDELKQLIKAEATETRRHFDIALERQESRFLAVNEAISSFDERTQRGFAAIDERLAAESSETRAMIRLSYT